MAINIIIWDGISMAPRCALEAVEGLLRDIMQSNRPFGGKRLIIVVNDTANDNEGRIHILEKFRCQRSIATEIFGETIDPNDTYFCERAILAPMNLNVRQLNNDALERLCTSCQQDEHVYKNPVEYLNTLEPTGMPPHELLLKKGAIVMLLRNLDVVNGLCNGTRLRVETLGRYVLGCRFVYGSRKSQLAVIPRIDNYWGKQLPFQAISLTSCFCKTLLFWL
ncbi:hypothetical protein RB195_024217 [Necator americanus]|uniref:ATP-dependent DNA helicase n=2 Tax=Necator americanus TaxID=51031 RepID=A0ABR1EM95_NECAM